MTESITIQGIEFTSPETRYELGHICNVHEAQALNVALMDRIKNNFGLRIKREREGRSTDFSNEEIETLRKEFSAYCASYQMGLGVVQDPIEKEAERIAKNILSEALNRDGKKL